MNALRFFAFFIVFLKHLSGGILENQLPVLKILTDSGSAVEFFFVLAGFLFTYLLLQEKEQTKDFSFKKFYLKRILSTWPLFFFIIFAVYFLNHFFWNNASNLGLHPVDGYTPNWRYSIFFLENYKMWYQNLFDFHAHPEWFPKFSPLGVTWFICIQEHFYLVWPLIIILIPTKRLPKVFIGLIIFSFLLKLGIAYYFNRPDVAVAHDLFTYLDLYSIGGLLGYFTYKNFDVIREIISKIPFWFKTLFIVFLLGLNQCQLLFYHASYFTRSIWNIIIGIAFVFLLAIFLPQENNFKFKRSSIFEKLGKMTYSLYLIHLAVIHIILSLFQKNEFNINSPFNYLVFFTSTLFISIIVSFITYTVIEKPFLRLKSKLS